MNNHNSQLAQKGPEKKRIVISKSAKKGTEMVVYHTRTKRGLKSETCHEIVAPKMRQVKKALLAL